MSRTYRNNPYGCVKFCNNCNRPVWYHTKEVYELCDCPPKTVKMRVKDYQYIWNDNYPEASDECDEWQRFKKIDNGWKVEERKIPSSTYYRYDVQMIDGNSGYPYNKNAGTRKDAQKYRNTKLRQKTKQVLNDRTTPYEEMVFPIKKNEVDWDIY